MESMKILKSMTELYPKKLCIQSLVNYIYEDI